MTNPPAAVFGGQCHGSVGVREWVCINGRLMPADQALVSVFDSGFMQGVGLFSTMRAYEGRVFRLQRHLDRLKASAAALGWTHNPDEELMRSCVEQVVAATEQADARVRLTVTTGTLRAGHEAPAELLVVANASPGVAYPEELYRKGVTVAVSRFRQHPFDPIIGHKTTSYFSRLASLREAHQRGAFEALWLNLDAQVAEGAMSSVFAVQDGVLVTPPLDTPVLPGITRATVLEIAAKLRIAAREQPLTLEEFLACDEAFLTSSLFEIMPVVRLERRTIGSEKPGDLTAQIFKAYGDLIEEECEGG
ncbi:MAG: 4-amino-4-deoxychorismate lyase [Planctomycetota bacterium]